jgi:hypothetical protein
MISLTSIPKDSSIVVAAAGPVASANGCFHPELAIPRTPNAQSLPDDDSLDVL